jgi:hypothetical protein
LGKCAANARLLVLLPTAGGPANKKIGIMVLTSQLKSE